MSNTEEQTMNRWLPIAGGVSMNLALGSLYAWSIFVGPLAAEFGWTRTQIGWVFSIAIVTFASSFVLAGRIQDQRGPLIPAAIGGTLVGLGFVLASFTNSSPFCTSRSGSSSEWAMDSAMPAPSQSGRNGSPTNADWSSG